jgi:hypothetical protein
VNPSLCTFHETTVSQIIGGRWVWWCTCAQADTCDSPSAAARATEQHKSGWQIGCVTGRHADDGRCLCAAEVRRLQASGLDELDAVALILGHATGVQRTSSGDADDVRNDSANEDLVRRHDNIIANESRQYSRG